jgi:hypothetical protein
VTRRHGDTATRRPFPRAGVEARARRKASPISPCSDARVERLKTRSAVCTAPRRDDGHRHRRSSERETTAANGDGEGGADPSLGDSSLVENVRFGDEELFVFDDFVRSLSTLWVVNRQKTNMRFGSFVCFNAPSNHSFNRVQRCLLQRALSVCGREYREAKYIPIGTRPVKPRFTNTNIERRAMDARRIESSGIATKDAAQSWNACTEWVKYKYMYDGGCFH